MDILHKGYWLGKSTSYVKKDTLREMEDYFQLADFGHDVSVLSETGIYFCFFFYEANFDSLFITTTKLCRNLGKKLVVIHKDCLSPEIKDLDVVFATLDLSSNSTYSTIRKLSRDVEYSFHQHKEVLSTHGLNDNSVQQELSQELLEVLRYIDGNLSGKIREEDIADYCHYSVTYFSKLFHKSIGVCFRDYVTLKRIALAKKLLAENKREKISFVAFQCGYNDVSYFSRIFKKKTGYSPAIYRQMH
ncbi:helix-turn-helix domain-containing protein [Vibrio sp. OCN044]|uniref:Helix-turn-helix domain-containing protein n=1 Tax=Vibrio tetraodonis subsp. pristinus TaxID=2695891 RepID=A0A6L8LNL2_9VIBR|nr:AraC family transcriptional regulator [Vibrio tetraodonis]MYM57641.1 helix-turn-helix domain-containing protein [Vibrio tetraodonis subsp. pristinus]